MELKYLFILTFLTSFAHGAPEHREDGHYDKHGKHSDEHDHKIFLGDEQQKEFSQMTIDQSVENLGKIVDKIDKNGDGNVTVAELTDWIRYISLKEPKEKAKNDYNNIYKKKLQDDGMVSWQEYLDVNFPGKHQTMESTKPRIEYFRKRFNAADINKDGKLSVEEFTAFRQPYLFPHMHDLVVVGIIEELDHDKDGKITIKDRLAGYGPEEEEAVKTEFKHRDANQDGVLDAGEVKEWYFPTSYDVNENEARHLLRRADSNKDDVLTKEEILANHDVFVGSKATQWGETLKRSVDEL